MVGYDDHLSIVVVKTFVEYVPAMYVAEEMSVLGIDCYKKGRKMVV